MADKIYRLPEFIKAVENEFDSDESIRKWADNYMPILLGERIIQVKNGRINEDMYINSWVEVKRG